MPNANVEIPPPPASYREPVSVGTRRLASRFNLAPLAGYTNLPFRLSVREVGGVGLCTTDLVASSGFATPDGVNFTMLSEETDMNSMQRREVEERIKISSRDEIVYERWSPGMDGSGALDDLTWDAQFPHASIVARNGSGVNRVALASASAPVLSGPWTASLDCRAFGDGLATLALSLRATSGPLTPIGERLIGTSLLARTSLAFAGSPSSFAWDIPSDPALIGRVVHVQGCCASTSASFSPRLLGTRGGLSNALDLTLGF